MARSVVRHCVTLWGKIEYRRTLWRLGQGQSYSPIDVAIGLRRNHHYSRGVRRKMVYAGAVNSSSFAEASRSLKEMRGLEISATDIQRETLLCGQEMAAIQQKQEAEYARPEQPGESLAEREVDTLVGAIDGTMVMSQHRKRGPKPKPKAQAQVVEIESLKPSEADSRAPCLEQRYMDEIAAAQAASSAAAAEQPRGSYGREIKLGLVSALGDRAKTSDGRPLLLDKRVVATVEKIDVFSERMKALMCRYGYRHAKRVVILGDGAMWIWAWVIGYLGEQVIQILDFYHVKEHLRGLAKVVYHYSSGQVDEHGEPKDEHPEVKSMLDKIIKGKVDEVIDQLQSLASELSGDKRQKVLAEVTYLKNNRLRMRYPQYLEAGLPIGSGCVESLGKHMIKQRMCGCGQRWEEPSIHAVVAIRQADINHEIDAYWNADPQRLRKAA